MSDNPKEYSQRYDCVGVLIGEICKIWIWECLSLPSYVLIPETEALSLWLLSLALTKGHSPYTLVAGRGDLPCFVNPEQ